MITELLLACNVVIVWFTWRWVEIVHVSEIFGWDFEFVNKDGIKELGWFVFVGF